MTLLLKAAQSFTNNITDYYRIMDKNGKMTTSSNSNSNSNLDTSQDKNLNKQNFSNSSNFVIPKETHKLYISDVIYPIIESPRFSISIPILLNDIEIFSYSTVNDKIVPNDNKIIFNGIIETSVRSDKLKGFVEYSMLSSQLNDIAVLDRKGVVMLILTKI